MECRAWQRPTWFLMAVAFPGLPSPSKDVHRRAQVRRRPLDIASSPTDYFKTLNIRTVRGRTFHATDARRGSAADPLVRTAAAAGAVHRIAGAAGRSDQRNHGARRSGPARIRSGGQFRVLFSPPIAVIGIVADARNAALSDEPVAEFYLSDLQEPQSRMTLLIRSPERQRGAACDSGADRGARFEAADCVRPSARGSRGHGISRLTVSFRR